MKIQKTTITGGNVEMLIADAPAIEGATEWVHSSVKIAVQETMPIAALRIEALRRLQDVLNAEIDLSRDALNRIS